MGESIREKLAASMAQAQARIKMDASRPVLPISPAPGKVYSYQHTDGEILIYYAVIYQHAEYSHIFFVVPITDSIYRGRYDVTLVDSRVMDAWDVEFVAHCGIGVWASDRDIVQGEPVAVLSPQDVSRIGRAIYGATGGELGEQAVCLTPGREGDCFTPPGESEDEDEGYNEHIEEVSRALFDSPKWRPGDLCTVGRGRKVYRVRWTWVVASLETKEPGGLGIDIVNVKNLRMVLK